MNGYIVVYHSWMLNRCLGFFLCSDVHSNFCGIPSTLSSGRIFLLEFSNLVFELIYHLHLVLRCNICICLLTSPACDLFECSLAPGDLPVGTLSVNS